MLEIKRINKYFGDNHVLKNVDLQIQSNKTTVIIGSSGSGKSTLLRCINLLEIPDSGVIKWENEILDFETKIPKSVCQNFTKKTGMVFQSFNLFPHKTAIENIIEAPITVLKKSKEIAVGEAVDLLKKVGLEDKKDSYPWQLSGGQQQRIAIARALASNPKILLCDEATSALDPQTTASILDLLKEINQKFGITIVIITHQMSVVREICSHVAIMKSGEVVEDGKVSEIFTHPKSDVARELISRDLGNDIENTGKVAAKISKGKNVRIVFSENSSFEPVIANMILQFNEPVNILKANTKNVGGVAKGEMILGFQEDSNNVEKMKEYLIERGLEIEEVDNYVE